MTKVEPGTAIVISAVLHASLMPFFGTRTGKSEIRLRQPIKGSKHNSANTWIHPIAPAKRKRANLPIQISFSWKITTKASYAGSTLAIYKYNKRIVNNENQKHVFHCYILYTFTHVIAFPTTQDIPAEKTVSLYMYCMYVLYNVLCVFWSCFCRSWINDKVVWSSFVGLFQQLFFVSCFVETPTLLSHPLANSADLQIYRDVAWFFYDQQIWISQLPTNSNLTQSMIPIITLLWRKQIGITKK